MDPLVAAGLATTAAAGGFVAAWPTRDRLVKRRLRDRVVVTLKSGAAFSGVLFEADGKSYVLRGASALGFAANGADAPVDGEIIVARSNVEHMQRP